MNTDLSAQKSELKVVESAILDTPELKDLTSEQLEKIAQLVIIQRYTEQMNKEVEMKKYNYSEMKEIFISTSGRNNSKNTQNAYRNALKVFEAYLKEKNIENPLSIDYAVADDFYLFIKKFKQERVYNSSVLRGFE